ncbi:hypothetical protein Q4517_01460 [Tenacibaculum sp. 1_MG-2023]|uniref:hypothetical protein n=1 Tax=Tenacibaculum sp. 1_MG-2023 TaxID=3062653 RepID=UPI0026E3527E|nr:hypothetical protein [Tenacibaculum sp. 1_MG-2023]MDO6674215.1 hypothetical protein [Tenacibaculum sp. 1_MG-2023]
MHKKLASDLTSLAHSILQMKNREDVFELKQKAYEVYEKLSVLAYVEEYINNTPNPTKTKEELLKDVLLAEEKKEAEVVVEEVTSKEEKISVESKEEVIRDLKAEVEKKEELIQEEIKVEEPVEEKIQEGELLEERKVHHLEEDLKEGFEQEADEIAEKVIQGINEEITTNDIIEQPFGELEELLHGDAEDVKNDVKDVGERKIPTLEDELQDTISVDVMTDLFTKAEPKKSLNDHFQQTIQIDLNDRIAFVKHLFNGDQNDFNRVISQLNTIKTEKEAKKFINKMIKPDYDWSEKEEYENRLLEIIERRFA